MNPHWFTFRWNGKIHWRAFSPDYKRERKGKAATAEEAEQQAQKAAEALR